MGMTDEVDVLKCCECECENLVDSACGESEEVSLQVSTDYG